MNNNQASSQVVSYKNNTLSEASQHSLHTESVKINFFEGPPSGPPLVFIHGGFARWQEFVSIIPAFTNSWHVYALDLRGHGKSGRTTGAYRLQDYADDLIIYMEQVCTGPVVIYGHSLGGMIALAVASQAPDRVRAVLVGDSLLSKESWREHLDRDRDMYSLWRDLSGKPMDVIIPALMDFPVLSQESEEPVPSQAALGPECPWFEIMAENLHNTDPDVFTALLDRFEETAEGYDLEEIMPRISAEVLFLQADPAFGGVMKEDEIDRAMALLKHATHVQFKKIGHGLHTQNRDPVLFIIKDYLENLK